jgi:hypothetical protein
MWVSRTADDVLLTCWPPAPDARNTSILMSFSSISTELSPSSSIGTTCRAANAVWRLPCELNGLMRTRRCTPPLGLQVAVGVAALDHHVGRRDAGLGPGRGRVDLGVEAPALGPAQDHAQHHLGPVLGVDAALARGDADQRVVGVVLAGEHRPQLDPAQLAVEDGQRVLDLGQRLLVALVAAQLVEGLGVLDAARQVLVLVEVVDHRRPARP